MSFFLCAVTRPWSLTPALSCGLRPHGAVVLIGDLEEDEQRKNYQDDGTHAEFFLPSAAARDRRINPRCNRCSCS
jgi:hypothetical protein